MLSSRSQRERELWNFCKNEYKTDPEYAFHGFMERKESKKSNFHKLMRTITSIFCGGSFRTYGYRQSH
tara:strand:+ start:94 stop:297 length:204 start_codon:yes stop_codon:yes gene_type:complete